MRFGWQFNPCVIKPWQRVRRRITARRGEKSKLELSMRALTESEQRYRRLFGTVSDAAVVFDLATRSVIDVNKSARELFGYPRKEFLRLHIVDLSAEPKRTEDVVRSLAQRQAARTPLRFLFKKDGTVFPAELSSGVFRVGGRRMVCALIRDITTRLELERGILAISEREQRRLGHDLHDELGPQLVGMEMLSRVLARDLAGISRPAEKRAAELADMSRLAARHIRDLARGLAPLVLESRGLAFALGDLAERTRKVFRVRCSYASSCRLPPIDPEPSVHLYRIAEEAVANALRHGRPTRIAIELQSARRRIELRITDNGRGWSPSRARGKGMGLRIMRYRAELAGGTLVVASRPGRGTSISCLLELPSHAMVRRLRQ